MNPRAETFYGSGFRHERRTSMQLPSRSGGPPPVPPGRAPPGRPMVKRSSCLTLTKAFPNPWEAISSYLKSRQSVAAAPPVSGTAGNEWDGPSKLSRNLGDTVTSVALSEDSLLFAACGTNTKALVYTSRDGKLEVKFTAGAAFNSCLFCGRSSPPNPIPPNPIPTQPTAHRPSQPNPTQPIQSYPIQSHPIPSHPIQSQPIPSKQSRPTSAASTQFHTHTPSHPD